jgi:hypothetical protein
MRRGTIALASTLILHTLLGGCGGGETPTGTSASGGGGSIGSSPKPDGASGSNAGGGAGGSSSTGGAGGSGGSSAGDMQVADAGNAVRTDDLPPAGNPDGTCAVPANADLADVKNPRTVVGTGTPDTCTGDAVVDAVAKGGAVTFDCGPDPITITLTRTAKIVNDTGPEIVIDGGGKVTLSGGGKTRILYQNTCDEAQKWTTPNCDNQDHPRLTVQNLTFVDGNAKGQDKEGGGAIFARGGQLRIVNSRFFRNACDDVGPDIGGAAVRAFDQYNDQALYVVNSTFGGSEALGNVCSNGGGLSSIGVSYTVLNSLFSYNRAIGNGANPAKTNTPGGGSGGAIYNDGNTFTLTLCGTRIEHNHANEGGGAIFFVSNDRSGSLVIEDSVLRDNPSDGFETAGYPGIFVLANGDPKVSGSTLEK